MTQQSLVNIEYGSVADSSVVNGNFEYLDEKIDGVKDLITGNSGVNSEIATINSTLEAQAAAINGKQPAGSYVDTSTAQTVGGKKTFTGNPVFQGNGYSGSITIKRNSSGPTGIAFENTDGNIGNFSVNTDGIIRWVNDGGTTKILRGSNSNSVGSSTKPVYIDNSGIAQECGDSLAVSITGNAATATSATSATNATNATNDGDGNVIKNTYVKRGTSSAIGGKTLPVYIKNDGTVDVCDYTIAKSVPANAVFTDTNTTYTAGTGLSLSGTTFNHSTSAGYKHIPSGGASGQILKYSSSGTAEWWSGYDEELLPWKYDSNAVRSIGINVTGVSRQTNVTLSSTLLGSHYSSGCGYLYFSAKGNSFISLRNVTRRITLTSTCSRTHTTLSGQTKQDLSVLIPIKIGDSFQLNWDTDTGTEYTDETLLFIPSEKTAKTYTA